MREQRLGIGHHTLVGITCVRIGAQHLGVHGFGDLSVRMADARHIVVGVKIFGTECIRDANSVGLRHGHGVVIEEPVGASEHVFATGENAWRASALGHHCCSLFGR